MIDVTVHDLHPPAEVAASFHEVADALQRRDRAVNAALAQATRTRAAAAVTAQRVRREAEAGAAARELQSAADADAFAARASQLAALPAGSRELLQFRLGLAAVAESLAGRPKTLIDSADLPGRRALLLIDPALAPLLPAAKTP